MSGAARGWFGRWRGSVYTQHQLDALLASIGRATTPNEEKAWLRRGSGA